MGKVFCKKYNKELDALPFPPIPGEKGMSIMQNFSREAWDAWVDLQTMLINEKHLDLSSADDRAYLSEQMEKFFNNDQTDEPTGFKPLS